MIKINGEVKNLDNCNLLEYIKANGYKLEVIAVELNGNIIKKSDFANITLKDGDSVEIVSFVGGGWFMQVLINGKKVEMPKGSRMSDIKGDYDIFVRNGFGVESSTELFNGDNIIAVRKGEMPRKDNLTQMIFARNGEKATAKLKNACVCICGLGGLGSNIAAMLVRLGVGKLILVDFDIVDPTNLNRQNYFVKDIGSLKTIATERILKEINPYVELELKNVYVNDDNVMQVICGADIIVEAFDNPVCKAQLVNNILSKTDKYIVASSGMAGYASSNNIKTSNKLSRLFVCGDSESEAKENMSLMSPRVNICAGHQANMVLRLLLGIKECWLQLR